MRTEDFIEALARDAKPGGRSVARGLALACAVGAGAAVLLFVALLGVRADFSQAILTPWYPLKIIVLFAAAVAVAPVIDAMARPGARIPAARLLLPVALLAIGIVGDLMSFGASGASARFLGSNGLYCITLIPLLSAAPLIALLAALRAGAPTLPGVSGLAAGLLAGSIGGLLYGLYCPDDSPLFVALWYPIGIGFVVVVGGLAGRALLRW